MQIAKNAAAGSDSGSRIFFGKNDLSLSKKHLNMSLLWKKAACLLLAYSSFIIHHSSFIKAQPGCTDPQATNFSPSATSNDGSCQYPPTNIFPIKIANLPTVLESNSGLVLAGGRLWSHNDSDQIPKLFSIDTTTGNILQTIDLQGITKTDWEDIATDGQRIFIGDFGNNYAGNRTNLAVYSIEISKIKPVGDDTLDVSEIEKIPFSYPDQTDFTPAVPNATAFDCEAFFYKNGRLHLFSKNWTAGITTHYALDPATGVCEKIEVFPTQSGLITAADLAADGSAIALLGYDLGTFSVFAWLLWDYPGNQFFSGNKRKINLGSVITLGQSEGLAWSSGGFSGFLSNEKIQQGITIPAAFWRFDFSGIFKNSASDEAGFFEKKDWLVYPNPATELIHFQPVMGEKLATARLFDAAGKLVLEQKTTGELALPTGLKSGIYYLEIRDVDQRNFSGKIRVE